MSCRNHPQVLTGLEHCYRCGYRFCDECLVSFQGHLHCGGCKDEAVGMLESGQPERLEGGDGELPPWERRAQLGLVAAFVETVKAVLFEPTEFFRRMDKKSEQWDCLVVPVVIYLGVSIVSAVTQMLFFGSLMAVMGIEIDELAGNAILNVVSVIAAPIVAVIAVLIYAGCMHLWLHMTGNTSHPFHQTMRGYCYSFAPNVCGLVPIVGGFVGWVWSIVTTVIMLKQVHRTTTGHAVMAALWLYFLGICLAVGFAVLLFGVVAIAASGQ